MSHVLFLPGAGGSPDFWRPVADRLPAGWTSQHFGWPGLGNQPHDSSIGSIDDLVDMVASRVNRHVRAPVDVVAQSMGGIVATKLALAYPALVRRLVLAVTSGGVDMARFGATDWRPDYRTSFPDAAPWITEQSATQEVAVERISAPTLLVWGDADPISPVAVGRHLALRIPDARLEIVTGGDHDLARTHPEIVARLIAGHLGTGALRVL